MKKIISFLLCVVISSCVPEERSEIKQLSGTITVIDRGYITNSFGVGTSVKTASGNDIIIGHSSGSMTPNKDVVFVSGDIKFTIKEPNIVSKAIDGSNVTLTYRDIYRNRPGYGWIIYGFEFIDIQ